jgi:hypothetical protein
MVLHMPFTHSPHRHCDDATHCTQLPPLQKKPELVSHGGVQLPGPLQVLVFRSQVPFPQSASCIHCTQTALFTLPPGATQYGVELGVATTLVPPSVTLAV